MCARERILPIPNMCEMLLHMHINCMGEQRQAFIAQMHYCCSTKLFETGKFTQSKVVGIIFWICFVLRLRYVMILLKMGETEIVRGGKEGRGKGFCTSKFIYVWKIGMNAEIYTLEPMWMHVYIQYTYMYCISRVLYKFKILFLHDNIFRCKIANRTFFPTWLPACHIQCHIPFSGEIFYHW